MNRIDELIHRYCPNGVEFKTLADVTIWDKRFSGVGNKTVSFKHVSAAQLKQLEVADGDVRLLATGKFNGYTTEEIAGDYINEGEVITIPSGGSANLKYHRGKFIDSGNILAIAKNDRVNLKFVYYLLLAKNELIQSHFRGSGVAHPSMSEILQIKIPVPPVEVQEEIVNILDKFTQLEAELSAELSAELEARRKQYEYYLRDLMIPDENTQYSSIQELCILVTDGSHISPKAVSEGYCMPSVKDMRSNGFDLSSCKKISKEDYDALVRNGCKPQKNDVLIAKDGSMLKYAFSIEEEQDLVVLSSIAILRPKIGIINPKYLAHYFGQEKFKETVIRNYSSKGGVPRIVLKNFKKIKIPIPTIAEQNEIVNILDKFEDLMNEISGELPAEITARRKQYEYYRTKLLTFLESSV